MGVGQHLQLKPLHTASATHIVSGQHQHLYTCCFCRWSLLVVVVALIVVVIVVICYTPYGVFEDGCGVRYLFILRNSVRQLLGIF